MKVVSFNFLTLNILNIEISTITANNSTTTLAIHIDQLKIFLQINGGFKPDTQHIFLDTLNEVRDSGMIIKFIELMKVEHNHCFKFCFGCIETVDCWCFCGCNKRRGSGEWKFIRIQVKADMAKENRKLTDGNKLFKCFINNEGRSVIYCVVM